ncbi:ethylbenzene dehydrogenase-related protein [Vibrio nigripulchritudo]|uniref:ethylbenzene dehydrogenase-related protein n=1 Tax=Vibrio nigripulchritudo TaxID=28173 RepID=UPI00190E0197|nr:ethylbenzene dehydrogenase-related protein [Vibrio nigripulchritudo]
MNPQRFNFVLLHLIVSISALVNLFTGLRIHLVSNRSLYWLSPLLPEGQMHDLHYLSGVILFAAVFGYVVYLALRKKRATKPTSSYHLWVQYFGYGVTISALITGGLYWWQSDWLNLQAWHFWSAIGMLVFLILHSLVYIIQYGASVLKLVLPFRTLKQARLSFTLLLTLTTAGAGWAFMTTSSQMPLQVHRLSSETLIEINGKPDEVFWSDIPYVSVKTTGGANFENGATTVSIKAAANEYETYFLFRWKDETKSLAHLPLFKQDGKWVVRQNGFHEFDETVYYEDKFAVMISSTCGFGADGTAYLGRKPIKGKPENWHGKGYHASMDNKIRDLWHWKAVRTNDMFQADDNFFGAPSNARFGQRRYTAGYLPDGKDSGGYKMNWKWYSPKQITPKRLPKAESDITKPLAWFGSQPYKANLDTYSEGTELPSVLYRSNQFEGDRANVRARGIWKDGYWTLEVSRQHNTGSQHDVALENGTCIWVSAFDHSQVAHTRHHRPFQLEYL